MGVFTSEDIAKRCNVNLETVDEWEKQEWVPDRKERKKVWSLAKARLGL